MLENTGVDIAGRATGPVGGSGIEVGLGAGGWCETIVGGKNLGPSRCIMSTASWAVSTCRDDELITDHGRSPRVRLHLTVEIVAAVITFIVSPVDGTWLSVGM